MLGTGTVNDPYQITNREELESVDSDLSACYKLMNDIDLSSSEWKPIGLSVDGKLIAFTGKFDGNGKKVLNARIRIPTYTSSARAGIFGTLGAGSVVKKLGIENVNVYSTSHYVGTLAGNTTSATIEECYATGVVQQEGAYRYAGGLVGYTYNSTVRNCYTNVQLSTGNLDYYGGFTGYAVGATTIVQKCLSYGIVKANNAWLDTGGFVGRIPTGTSVPKFDSCFFDLTVLNGKGNVTGSGVSGVSTSFLKSNIPAYPDDIWYEVEGHYPKLKAFEEIIIPIIEEREVMSYTKNIVFDLVLNKVATKKVVISTDNFYAQAQKTIKAVKVGTTFIKDIVSGVSREVQVVKVGRDTVTSYILPITSDIEATKQQVRLLEATVTSHMKSITSDVKREVKALKQSLSFIDLIMGRAITPNLKTKQIKAIVNHIENGTLAQYLFNQYNVSILTDSSIQSEIENNTSVNALENQTLSEVRE